MKTNGKILSLILALALIFSTAPLTALAEDSDSLGLSLGASGRITAFAELPDDIRWQRDYIPDLPETLEATVNGDAAQVPVTWEAEGYNPASLTQSGLFMFYAAPGAGYTLAEGVRVPKITVLLLPKVSFFMAGMGDAANPLKITRADQLAEIAELVNDSRLENLVGQDPVYLRLENDITLTGEWTPIGTGSNTFKGHFDGGGHEISGLTIDASSTDNIGLFGAIGSGGSVANLGIVDAKITGDTSVGGVAGDVRGSVTSCYVTGAVNGSYIIGGVAGSVGMAGSVTGCYSTAAVSATDNMVGGVAGGVGGSVTNCYSTGAVSGVGGVGGVAGIVDSGSVTNCYSTGAVSGDYYVGGVAGFVTNGGSVTDCAALNPSVKATGSPNPDAGRVAGRIENSATLTNNAAFGGIVDNNGYSSFWSNPGAGDLDGEDITADDATDDIGGRFPLEYWEINYELPLLRGLDGQDQQMPAHLIGAYTLYFFGSGTDADPYKIVTAAQLKSLADLVNAGISDYNYNKHYKLMNDINLTGEWTPIGHDNGSPFQGHFNGSGYTIRGLYIDKTGADAYSRTGLFGRVDNGSVENLGLVGVDVTGGNFVGGVAGSVNGGSVENCSVTGKVGGDYQVGGVAGSVNGGSVTGCYSTATVSGRDSVGGVAGSVDGRVENCYSTGAVSGDDHVGGVAGIVQTGGSVTSCYATGAVIAASYAAGGVAGTVDTTSSVNGCAALNPRVYGLNTMVGRVVGQNNNASGLSGNVAFSGMIITNTISGTNTATDIDGENRTAGDLQVTGGFPNALTQSPWIYAPGKLPGLGAPVEMPGHISGSYFPGGNGSSEATAFQIKTAEQLASLAALVNADNSSTPVWADKYYKLMNDITLTGEWAPIGFDGLPFQGHFDGGYHTISGLKIDDSLRNYAGLFGYVEGGSVKNLGLVGVDVSGGDFVGGVAGYVLGGSMENCYVTGAVSGDFAGGVAGIVNNGSVENCYVTGVVSGSNCAGGVAGYIWNGSSVKNCYSTATVSGDGVVGGVAGYVSDSSVENCYSTGPVSGTGTTSSYYPSYGIGGVAGDVQGGSVKNCAALNPSVKGTGATTHVGRVAGDNAGGALSGNYAFISMAGGNWVNIGANNLDGAHITKIQAVTPSFWTDTMGWSDTVWTLAQGKLPTLTGLAGQDGEPGLSLTGLPTGDLTITPQTATAKPGDSVAFTVTRMESWTHQKIDWTTTAGDIVETVNGKATLTVPANAAGGTTITVTAENENSGKSVSATVTVITVPGAPENLTAIPGDGQVTLSWSAPASDGGAAVTLYEVAGGLVGWASVPSSETSYTLTGLTNGTEYAFKVRAVNDAGYGPEATVTATPVVGVPVTGVHLNQATLTLVARGDTKTLTATVLPANASNKKVTWSSSDTAVAWVDANGIVGGVSEGKATITVTTVDGGKTATCAVTVRPEGTVLIDVTGVRVSPTSLRMSPGNTRQLTATVIPADATIRDVSWSSSDHAVATVDGSGQVTAVASGSATITATTVDGGFVAICAVTVTSGAGGYTPGGSSGGSGSGSGSSGSGSTTSTTTTSTTPSNVSQSQATDAAAKAAAAAKASGGTIATVNMRNVGSITLAALQAMAKAAGMPVKFQADSMSADGKAVEVRITLDPGKSTKGLNLSASTSNAGAKTREAMFEKWFRNNVSVVSFAQQGDFGQPVEIAAKVDLTGMDTKNLYFYSYDKKTNTYRRIEKPAYWIDKNGYLRFVTELAGDIIISEGPLERK